MRLFLFLCGLIKKGFPQSDKNIKIIRQKSFVYSDTVLGKIYLGNYEATGIIRGDDSSYLVSTKYAIQFPELLDTALIFSDSEKDYKRYQLYYSKENISSGNVFKLDKDFNKAWEVKFKDKRVTHILPFDSSSFIVAG